MINFVKKKNDKWKKNDFTKLPILTIGVFLCQKKNIGVFQFS
jgi:hypothetical protein